MQNILLRNTLPEAGQIIVGCMRMDSRTPQELANMIDDLADRGTFWKIFRSSTRAKYCTTKPISSRRNRASAF